MTDHERDPSEARQHQRTAIPARPATTGPCPACSTRHRPTTRLTSPGNFHIKHFSLPAELSASSPQASIAQLVEQLIRNQQVWSSSLHAGSRNTKAGQGFHPLPAFSLCWPKVPKSGHLVRLLRTKCGPRAGSANLTASHKKPPCGGFVVWELWPLGRLHRRKRPALVKAPVRGLAGRRRVICSRKRLAFDAPRHGPLYILAVVRRGVEETRQPNECGNCEQAGDEYPCRW